MSNKTNALQSVVVVVDGRRLSKKYDDARTIDGDVEGTESKLSLLRNPAAYRRTFGPTADLSSKISDTSDRF